MHWLNNLFLQFSKKSSTTSSTLVARSTLNEPTHFHHVPRPQQWKLPGSPPTRPARPCQSPAILPEKGRVIAGDDNKYHPVPAYTVAKRTPHVFTITLRWRVAGPALSPPPPTHTPWRINITKLSTTRQPFPFFFFIFPRCSGQFRRTSTNLLFDSVNGRPFVLVLEDLREIWLFLPCSKNWSVINCVGNKFTRQPD